ncbi:UNVERIFIED_CONTAM: hypothetical protein Sradi_3289600 [Sesamum radiatum]|uniref:Disease resistance N-terminal domain-containing protein n=1 Tax=Sesamum radiatum TaxID=300843 RepID=A0AAW2R1I9_SESRA
MAEAALTFLLENLQQLPGDQIHLISGAEYELKQLQDELISMKSFLQDSASKRVNSELFKTLEKQIRDVVYTAEDTIDACLLNQAAAGAINRKSKLQKNVFSLVTEIKSLRKHMVKLADEARMMFAALQSTDEAPVQDTVDRLPKVLIPTRSSFRFLVVLSAHVIK